MDRLNLSPAAQQVLEEGLLRNLTSVALVRLIKKRTGEVVSDRTIRRRAAELHRAAERRTEIRNHVEDFVAGMKAANWYPPEVVLALVFGLLVASWGNLERLAHDAPLGSRPLRALMPESESDREAWRIVRRLREKLNRGQDLGLADADELGALCRATARGESGQERRRPIAGTEPGIQPDGEPESWHADRQAGNRNDHRGCDRPPVGNADHEKEV